jgi:phytoene synthase
MTAAEQGYRACRTIARESATNFYYGMRLLPRAGRDALYAVYAFARRVDDVADGELPVEERLRELAGLRQRARSLGANGSDPVFAALADAAARFDLPLDALEELVDGAEMDVRGTTYETFDDLLPYCRHVAGTIGRLSLAVFRPSDRAAAEPRAVALGVAFQLTNIVRDVREDLARGRVYLPRQDLERFGCRLEPGETSGPLPDLIRFEAGRARSWFDDGLALLPFLDRSSAASVAAMAGIYGRLLQRIERRPEAVLEGRLSLPGWEKGWIAARSLVRAA